MADQPMIVIRGVSEEAEREQVRRIAGAARVEFAETAAEVAALAPEADAIAGEISPEVLASARGLRWLHSWAAGPHVYPELVDHPVVMTSAKGNGGVPLAEQAMLLMLMLNRSALRWIDAQRDRRWERFTHGELAGLTCGIVGLGHAGADLVPKARAFHMRVLGVRREASIPVEGVDRLYAPEQLGEMLPEADFVVVTAPLTEQTRDMFGAAEFRAMKDTAFWICISRGGIANDSALQRALEEGWIAGAGIDAHGVEPLPADSPFWTLPNTIITPHNGATSGATRQRGMAIFLDNLGRFVRGEPVQNLVDKPHGY
ncbi:MAG TPA: D-2-hydroxyacid dehydrogenase [Mycobacteriales bacterium]|nr:D-2-hydroxyacid dehydrogenase [Mycobacteriales bacterium]